VYKTTSGCAFVHTYRSRVPSTVHVLYKPPILKGMAKKSKFCLPTALESPSAPPGHPVGAGRGVRGGGCRRSGRSVVGSCYGYVDTLSLSLGLSLNWHFWKREKVVLYRRPTQYRIYIYGIYVFSDYSFLSLEHLSRSFYPDLWK